MRKKKGSLLLKQQTIPDEHIRSNGIEPILDDLVKLSGELGFSQTLPPVFEEKKIFHELELNDYYGSSLIEVGSASKPEIILSPTHFFNIIRLYADSLANRDPYVAKWFYVMPVVRGEAEKPKTEYEFGAFILGDDSALASAHLINLITQLISELGITELAVEITSRGCEVCQKDYQRVLADHLGEGNLCDTCLGNLEGNVFALFDCQNISCQSVLAANTPQMIDFLDESCRGLLMETLETIDELEIPYVLNPSLSGILARDKIAFRLTAVKQEKETVIGQGGSFTRLSQLVTKQAVRGVGFLASLESLSAIPYEKKRANRSVEVFLIPMSMVAARRAMALHRRLRKAGIRVREAVIGEAGIKNKLKIAQDSSSEIALIIGQKEALEETAILRDMRSGMQEVFTIDRIVEEVKKRLAP